MLKPVGFFQYNPGRDLPPGPNKGELPARLPARLPACASMRAPATRPRLVCSRGLQICETPQ
jgi:hypothetical protein